MVVLRMGVAVLFSFLHYISSFRANLFQKGSTGAIYVFQNSGIGSKFSLKAVGGRSFAQKAELKPRNDLTEGARYGNALLNVGDLNQDGYEDFIVGAPYNGNHGSGTIYLYMGRKNFWADAKSNHGI